MKTLKTKFIFPALVIAAILFANSLNATTHTIGVGQGGNIFDPATTDVLVGDTVLFQWVSGTHTTTCDGGNGTSLPAGAATWNEMINSTSQTYSYVITVAGTYNYTCLFHPGMDGTINATVSSIIQTSSSLPERYNLNQNYPNPFNPSTNIKFDIVNAGFVKITIYNSLGKEVETLVNDNLSPGSYQIDWNASAVSSGVYFYKLETQGFVDTKKMLLVK